MSPNAMRWIDFWVGVPACFVLTLLHRFLRVLGLKDPRPAEPPRNILMVQLAEMGTMVVAEPAIRRLETYADALDVGDVSFAARNLRERLGIR